MSSLAESIAANPPLASQNTELGNYSPDDSKFQDKCLEEIERYRRLDQWIPSFHNILSTTALDCKAKLMRARIIPTNAVDFLPYTRDGCYSELRLNAFTNLVDLGLLQKTRIMKWFLFALGNDASPYIRAKLVALLGQLLGSVAIGEEQASASQPSVEDGGLIVEQESSTEARRTDLARKTTIKGALAALFQDFGQDEIFRRALWEATQSPMVSVDEVYDLCRICRLLYKPEKSQVIKLAFKRHWRVRSNGKTDLQPQDGDSSQNAITSHILVFTRDGPFKTTRDPPAWVPKTKDPPNLKRKRSDSYLSTPEKTVRLKAPKKPKDIKPVVSRINSAASFQNVVELGEEIHKPFKIKLNMGSRKE